MSHEIRTPMNAVVGLAQILMMSKPLSPQQQEYISTLQISAQSLLMLINDLLDIAKIESEEIQLEKAPFNLRTLLEEVASISSVQANEKSIALHYRYGDRLREGFLGDSNRLKQILLNLVSNAVKFTERGEVSIAITLESEQKDLSTVKIAVSDTGIGIPADKLTSIFNKFSQADTSITRKYGGTGLGLAITRTLVRLMDGEISLTSEQGKGSAFTISLPLAHSAHSVSHAQKKTPARETETLKAGMKAPCILLVEDYKPNVLVATTLLERLGYRYDTAANGEEAIRKVAQGGFDVVLMDVQMPDIDGYTATRTIREDEKRHGKPRVPIIGITAYALSGDRERCIESGMDDYISKPFDPDALEHKILGFLRAKAA